VNYFHKKIIFLDSKIKFPPSDEKIILIEKSKSKILQKFFASPFLCVNMESITIYYPGKENIHMATKKKKAKKRK